MATPEEVTRTLKARRRTRLEKSVLLGVLMVVLSGLTSFILAVAFAQHAANQARVSAEQTAEKFTKQFCKVIVLLDDQYKALPQNKLTQGQKDFIAAMIQLRADYKCDDK